MKGAVAALACGAAALAGGNDRAIVPSPGVTVSRGTFDGVYRLFDDSAGVASGARFANIRATVRRGGFRLRGHVHDVVIRDVDLTLAAPMPAPELPAGIEIQGTAHDVLIERTTARDFRMVDRPKRYANGDGFSSEWHTHRLTFRQARAINNSDGGFDLKSKDTILDDTLAEGNALNYRLWGTGTAKRIESRSPGKGHVQLNANAKWHIGTLIARSGTPKPILGLNGNVTVVIDRCELHVPAGTPMIWRRPGLTASVSLGPGCETLTR